MLLLLLLFLIEGRVNQNRKYKLVEIILFRCSKNLECGDLCLLSFFLSLSLFLSQYLFLSRALSFITHIQCDQIGAIYCTMGNFSKPLATIILPKSPTFLGNLCKDIKAFFFPVKSFLGKFYRHWATFFWSHCTPVRCHRSLALYLVDTN